MSTSPPEAAFAAPADPTPAPDLNGSPSDPFATPPLAPPTAGRRLALAALILGICAFVLGWVPFLGILLGAAAVVVGILALVKRQKRAFAITGISLGAVGLISSIVASAFFGFVLANLDTIVTAAQEQSSAPSVVPSESAPEPSDAPEEAAAPASTVDLTAFAEADAATFAAIAADADAHVGEQLVIYGEVSQFDDITGPCGLLVGVSNAQQATWEGYQQPAVGVAGGVATNGDPVCPQLAGVANLSHVKLWVTVDGVYEIDMEAGVQALPGFDIHQVEFLPAL